MNDIKYTKKYKRYFTKKTSLGFTIFSYFITLINLGAFLAVLFLTKNWLIDHFLVMLTIILFISVFVLSLTFLLYDDLNTSIPRKVISKYIKIHELEVLRNFLGKPHKRRFAIEAIGIIGNNDALKIIMETLTNTENFLLQKKSAEILTALSKLEAIDPLKNTIARTRSYRRKFILALYLMRLERLPGKGTEIIEDILTNYRVVYYEKLEKEYENLCKELFLNIDVSQMKLKTKPLINDIIEDIPINIEDDFKKVKKFVSESWRVIKILFEISSLVIGVIGLILYFLGS